MPLVFSHVDYCDIHFAIAMHMLLFTNTKRVFQTEGFRPVVYFKVFNTQCVRLVYI